MYLVLQLKRFFLYINIIFLVLYFHIKYVLGLFLYRVSTSKKVFNNNLTFMKFLYSPGLVEPLYQVRARAMAYLVFFVLILNAQTSR